MNFFERMAEDRRLVIVRLLERSLGYSANESLLGPVLRDIGHAVSSEQIRADLKWLQEAGLVMVEEIAGIQIASLTQRGLETAQGIVITAGVRRPPPGS